MYQCRSAGRGPARVSHTCHRLMSWQESEGVRERAGGMGRNEISCEERDRKTRRAQKKSSVFKVDGSGGTRPAGKRAQMVGNTQLCQRVKGEWNVCETDPRTSPPSSSLKTELRNGVLTAPLSFISPGRWRKISEVEAPTCRWAVYLLQHISCILYIPTFQRRLSLQRAHGLMSLPDSRSL